MKVSELSGAQLDYWVARSMGYQTDIKKIKSGGDWCDIELRSVRNVAPPDITISSENSACGIAMVPNAIREFPACVIGQKIGRGKHPYRSSWFYPSTVWGHGGLIIERERINLEHDGCYGLIDGDRGGPTFREEGPTILVAAMRTFVASKFGATVPDKVE